MNGLSPGSTLIEPGYSGNPPQSLHHQASKITPSETGEKPAFSAVFKQGLKAREQARKKEAQAPSTQPAPPAQESNSPKQAVQKDTADSSQAPASQVPATPRQEPQTSAKAEAEPPKDVDQGAASESAESNAQESENTDQATSKESPSGSSVEASPPPATWEDLLRAQWEKVPSANAAQTSAASPPTDPTSAEHKPPKEPKAEDLLWAFLGLSQPPSPTAQAHSKASATGQSQQDLQALLQQVPQNQTSTESEAQENSTAEKNQTAQGTTNQASSLWIQTLLKELAQHGSAISQTQSTLGPATVAKDLPSLAKILSQLWTPPHADSNGLPTQPTPRQTIGPLLNSAPQPSASNATASPSHLPAETQLGWLGQPATAGLHTGLSSSTAPSNPTSPPSGSLQGLQELASRYQLTQQLSRQITYLRHGSQREVQMTLEPASLGKLSLHLHQDQQNIHLQILTELPLAKDLLESQLQELKQQLMLQGLHLQQVSVNLHPDWSGGGQQQQSPSDYSGSQSSANGPIFSLQAEEEAPATQPPLEPSLDSQNTAINYLA